MPLFHPRVIEKNVFEDPIPEEHRLILKSWSDNLSNGIYNSETQNDAEFIQHILIDILGYVGSTAGNVWTVAKNQPIGSGNVDVALGTFSSNSIKIIAPFELKGAKTKDLDAVMPGRNKTPVQQAWEYANDAKGAQWVLVSNYREIRLYAYGYGRKEYETFDLSSLTNPSSYLKFILLLSAKNLLGGKTLSLLKESEQIDKEITNNLYLDYKFLRDELIDELIKNNKRISSFRAVHHAQTILDRILFIAFSEDKGLLPDHTLKKTYEAKNPFSPQPVWENFKGLFKAINVGDQSLGIPGYNGGLFSSNQDIEELHISDHVCESFKNIGDYDFESDVSVNILGHIFEQSISDIEDLKIGLAGNIEEARSISKRKKDGIFYTPEFVTRYIVEQTLGGWLNDRKIEIGFDDLPELSEDDYKSIKTISKGKRKGKITYNKKIHVHIEAWEKYKKVLSDIKVLDPACGSGAFLNEVFDYLYNEGQKINNELTTLNGGQIHLFKWDTHILSNNIYGVDINPESVELTKLSLWLKTANRGEKLTYLDNNIKCGNSLIHDNSVSGVETFRWDEEFLWLKDTDGFDVIVGNPPYGAKLADEEMNWLKKNYKSFEYQINTYVLFIERAINLLRKSGLVGFITPATFTYQHYFKKIRELIQKFEIRSISKYCFPVFEDAEIGDTISLVLENNPRQTSATNVQVFLKKDDVNFSHSLVEYSKLIRADGVFEFISHGFLEKVYQSTSLLGDFAQIIVGIKPYQTGKGVPKQTKDVVQKKPFTKDSQIDSSFHQCIVGSDFHRYGLIRKPKMWLEYGEWLAEPRLDAPFFDSEKIIIRQTADSIIAHLDTSKAVNLNNVYNVGKIAGNLEIKYLLGILNSTLVKAVYRTISQEKGKLYAEVKKVYLEKIPIKIIPISEQMDFVEKVDRLINLKNEIYNTSLKFSSLLKSEFNLEKTSKRLSNWHELEFADFHKELQKQKVKLNLEQRSEWIDFFEKKKSYMTGLKANFEEIDQKIDQMVYQLYELSSEDILSIERNV